MFLQCYFFGFMDKHKQFLENLHVLVRENSMHAGRGCVDGAAPVPDPQPQVDAVKKEGKYTEAHSNPVLLEGGRDDFDMFKLPPESDDDIVDGVFLAVSSVFRE